MLSTGILIGAIIYVFNVVAVIRSVIKDGRRFLIALPIVPWVICVLSIADTSRSLSWKLTSILLVTLVELFIDLGLSKLTRSVYTRSSPLHAAVKSNQLQRAQLLLDSGADVNDRKLDWSAVEIAAYEGHSDMVDLLIAHGASLDAWRGSAWGDSRLDTLGIAASAGHLHIVQQLVKKGTKVNSSDGLRSPALETAIMHHHYDIAEFLLKNGAVCGTALHIAVERGLVEAVKLLIRYGADVGVRDRNGRTALDLNDEIRSRHKDAIERALTEGNAR